LKLPKGIKKMREAASQESLRGAFDIASDRDFNGYIRTTAPKGVKQAGVVLFLRGEPKIAVYQSPARSLYGPDAINEVRRVSTTPGSTLRLEEFLAQTMDEVHIIVRKMRKARIEEKDVHKFWTDEESEGAPTTIGEEKAVPPGDEMEDGSAPVAEEPDSETEGEVGEDEPPGEDDETEDDIESVKTGRPVTKPDRKVRDRVRDRITASQKVSSTEDDDIFRVLKEVGMHPSLDEDEELDPDVNDYIAAFEEFLQKQKNEGHSSVASPTAAMLTADEIIDEMLEAAGDDTATREFIEAQRERIFTNLSMTSVVTPEDAAEKHDTLSHQQDALEQISSTFRDVLKATEHEAERRRRHLADQKAAGTIIDEDAQELEDEKTRMGTLEGILEEVLSTHKERLDSAEMELEEAELPPPEEAPKAMPSTTLDLEGAKKSLIDEMRERIHHVAADDSAKGGKVAESIHSISDEIHDQVEELELEHEILTKDRRRLEDKTEDLERRRDTLQVDQEIEVEARLRELEAKEADIRQKTEELLSKERHLESERSKVERDIEHARSKHDRIAELEATLKEREGALHHREEELDDKHGEVEGLKEHLEQEIIQRASELEDIETRLEKREKDLKAREAELEQAVKTTKHEREAEEADLAHVKRMEDELKTREQEFSASISAMEKVIDALREELRTNIERVEELEGKLVSLQEAEGRVSELEEKLAKASSGVGIGEGLDVDKDQMRRLLAYLDDLLSALPDKEIKKFSDSEYFELYGRILDRLGI
jgi:pilus assembly protein FimV